MQKELTRYLFIGDFDSLLLGLFSKRGEVIWVSSLEEALNQKGNFTVIMIESEHFSNTASKELSNHYPQTPIIVSNGEKPEEPPPYVRFVPFNKILIEEIAREERIARIELRVEELRRIHNEAKKMLILLHDNPDPDSIASALALRTLLKRNRQTATIGHLGEKISRPENVAMIDLLEIDLEKLLPSDIKEFDSIALVDVQPPHFGDLLPEVDTVIDHHPYIGSYKAGFSEIKLFGRALANHWISEGIFFGNLGEVKREYLIPKMADFGIQVKGIEWSVAYGIVSNSHLVISVRNVGYVKSAGRLVRTIFSELGSAGGHRSAAKAIIPLKKIKKLLGKASQENIKKWVTELFVKGVSEKTGEESS